MMNSLFRKINSQNVKRIFNFNFRQFSFVQDGSLDLFGAKKVIVQSKASGAGNKVANVSSAKVPAKKVKAAKVVEEVEEVKPKRKKAPPVKEPTEEEEEVVVKPKKKATPAVIAKNTKAAVAQKTKKAAASKKRVVKKNVVEEEEPEEEVVVGKKAKNPTALSKKSPKKAAHTVHTLQTEPANTKEVVQTHEAASESTPAKTKKKKQAAAAESAVVPAKKGRPAKQTNPNEFPAVDLNDPKSLGHVTLDTPLDPVRYTTNPIGLYEDYINKKSSQKTKEIIQRERNTLCNNYAPLPVICARGKGVYLQDIDGKIYIDFLSAYSAANQGHCNMSIINTAVNQMNQLYITSRAFYNNVLGVAADYVCKVFRFDKVLFMNSGAEGSESAIKLARRWGYETKKIPEDQAKIVYAKGNFMGRTIHLCGLSDDPSRYAKFGPYDRSSHYLVEYNNIEVLKEVLEKDPNIAAVFLEPIQGENGIIIPSQGYLKAVSDLCKEKNVLFIADEIQTGCGRTGFIKYCDSEGVQPDILVLGKSLSGGLYPVSAVLSSKEIMDTIKPGEHGSTYGGNPLAAHITVSAIHELIQENMVSNSYKRGIEFGLCLKELGKNNLIKEIRGRGLMYGVELWPDCGFTAYDFSIWLMERGILCKPTKTHTLRLSPPLVITREQIEKAADIIISVFNRAEALSPFKAPHPVTYNLVETDKNESDSFLEHRASKKLTQITGVNAELNANHPSKQIEELLQVEQKNIPTTTAEEIPTIKIPNITEDITAYSSSPSEILSLSLGVPTVDKTEQTSTGQDDKINILIIPH